MNPNLLEQMNPYIITNIKLKLQQHWKHRSLFS